jgi:cytochrome c-type biogenesis protein CcmF
MDVLGRACLMLGLAVALYGIGASLYGARAGRPQWVASGRRAVYALAGLCTTAFVVLEIAFLRSDFRFDVVASHSSTTTPTFYQAAAAWSSQEGSLLLWVFLLSVWSSLVLWVTRRRLRDVAPYATAVLLGFGAFFCALLVFLESPFAQTIPPPPEGAGLNPLLRHPSMMIHPPMLYSGYTLFAIPFAFAIGALVARRVDAEWIRSTRSFALAAWLFLGIGILLGARWSYAELGWGGYWAWDPVENASLMPWLTGTAFLHSVMVQEKRGMLKTWNVSLILATGVLAVMGTFLVRSGILDSIHAFGASTLGGPFLGLIAVLVAGSVALVVSRRAQLRSEHRLDSLLSREAIFVGNNVVLVGLCLVVGFGTFFPLIAEAVTGDRASVGPPWFNRYTVPLTLALVFLSGLGPLIAWRRTSWAMAWRSVRWPAVAGAVALLGSLALGAGSSVTALLMFTFGAFVVGAVGQEFWRGARARRAMSDDGPATAVVSLVRRNRRRYGGYLVHVGMAVLFVGVAASSAFQHQNDATLSPGQQARVGDYTVRYVEPSAEIVMTSTGRVERIALGAVLDVERGGERHRVSTERGYYPTPRADAGPVGRFFDGESTSEIGLKAGLLRDFWAAYSPDEESIQKLTAALDRRLADAPVAQQQRAVVAFTRLLGEQPPPGTFRLLSSPLVTWIWLGALLTFAGGLIALWPAPGAARGRVGARYKARVAQELSRA